MTKGNLSPLQLELLKIYSFNPSEEELMEVKKILANFFANRLTDKVQRAIETKGLTGSDFEKWLNED